MQSISSPRRVTSALAGAALLLGLLSACSSSKTNGNASGTTSPSNPSSTNSSAPAPSSNAGADQYGANIPVSNQAGLYGQSASNKDLYQGAGGYTLDLSKCPSGWNNMQGISSSSIDLYGTAPLSGPVASVGGIDLGIKSYFQYVNQNGGIGPNHLKVNFTIGDDQYNAALTAQAVNGALQSGKYAGMPAITGASGNLAVRSTLNKQCMPQFLTTASDPQFGDPQEYPWTSGFGLTYFGEAALWDKWMQQQFPSGVTVAEITMDNSFGLEYHAGFLQAISGTNIKSVGVEKFSPTAPNINDQLTTAAATKADVLLVEATNPFCSQAVTYVGKSSWKPKVVISDACFAAKPTFSPVIAQGLTGAGTYSAAYYLTPGDPNLPNPAFAQLLTSTLKAQGLDSTNAEYADGWMWGWYITEVLQDAASYRGGLNRANIMTAAYSINQIYPLMVKGITTRMDGLQRAYLVNSDQMFKYQVTDPKQIGTWVPSGGVVSFPALGNWQAVKQASPLAASLVGK